MSLAGGARAFGRDRGLVGSREQKRDLVLGGEALQDVGAERRGRCDRKPVSRPTEDELRPQLAERLRRASGVVRSIISVPSRWSISCCADAGVASSSSSGRPRRSRRAASVTLSDRSTGTRMPWIERQPSSSTSVSLLRSTICGLTTPRSLVLVLGLEDEEPLEHADLVRREADAAARRASAAHPLDEPLELVVEARDLARAHPQTRRRGTGGSAGERRRAHTLRSASRVVLGSLSDIYSTLAPPGGAASPRRRG